MSGIIQSGANGEEIHLSSALVQPVAADDVAAYLADLAVGRPLNATVEIAGPEAYRLNQLAEEYLSAKEDPRRVIADAKIPYFGAVLDERTLTPGDDARLGEETFESWMQECISPD